MNSILKPITQPRHARLLIPYVLQFDGASRGNPGKCSCGYVIYGHQIALKQGRVYLNDSNTNNYAEYMGLIYGMTEAKNLNINYLHVQGDSLLVINQVQGIYKVKSDNLKKPHELASNLIEKFTTITFEHIPRNLNKVADRLANQALDEI